MNSQGPIHGVQILDLTGGATGAYCSRLLAGFGAEVVLLEPSEGHPLRHLPPFKNNVPDPERSLIFAYLGAAKKSVRCDSHRFLEQVEIRLTTADALLIDEDGPRSAAELGISVAQLGERYPRLVVATFSDMGRGGEMEAWATTKLGLWAASGWLYQTGYPDARPLLPGGFMLTASMVGAVQAIGVLASLRSASETGAGSRMYLSALEAMIGLSYPFDTMFAATGRKMKRVGTGLASTFRVAKCKDGYVTICTASDAQREMLSYMVGQPEMSEQFVKCTGSQAWDDQVEKVMDAWLSQHTRQEALAEGQALRVPTGIVCAADEVSHLDQHQFRDFFVELDHPNLGHYRSPGAPVRFSRSAWQDAPPPVLGQAMGDPPQARAVTNGVANRSGRLPLEGVRVLELSSYFAGPLAGMYLADLGAEVIKVESVQRTDNWRATWTNPEAEEHWETSPFFNGVNRNKLGLTLNLVDPRGAEVFKRLAGASDIVLTNYSARVMNQFQLGYEVLSAVNPRLIMVSISGFGMDGPWRDYVSFAPVAESFAGVTNLVGFPEQEPSLIIQTPGDSLPAVHGVAAVIAALIERRESGLGQLIDVSQMESTTVAAADSLLEWEFNQTVRERSGNRHPRYAPHDTFPTSGEDAWIAICVRSDAEWEAFCGTMGQPALANNSDFGSLEKRQQNAKELYSLIAEWTAPQDKHRLARLLQANGVPAAPVNDPADIVASDELRARGVVQEQNRAFVGRQPYHACGIQIDGQQLPLRRPAPTLGGDNAYVLGELLGMAASELAELAADEVIGTRVAAAGTRWTF